MLVAPRDPAEAALAVGLCLKTHTDYYIIGNGTNILVSDKGLKGAVIKLAGLDKAAVPKTGPELCTLRAQAGAGLKEIAALAAENGLAGLEFAGGIPGSVGGAVYMNAGAYGGEIAGVLSSADILAVGANDCESRALTAAEMGFGYRTSKAQSEKFVILGAIFALKPGRRADILEAMRDYDARRARKQPLDMPSAGSVFKRPEGHFAGQLIMESGLSGCSVGGAQVSELHCGFIVNKGGATAKDVLGLIAHIRRTVADKTGVALEPEIRLLGDFY